MTMGKGKPVGFPMGRMGLALLSVFVLLLTGCDESPDKKFASYADVRDSGYLKRGWIPDCLPENSYHFLERHNVDTNETWVFCRFRAGAEDALLGVLSEDKQSEWRFAVRGTTPPSWWPASLPRRVKYYVFAPPSSCKPYSQPAVVAVDWESRYLYFKSP
jgi:hypothetical protein